MIPPADEGLAPAGGDPALRDLMGLVALPALWLGRDGRTIIQFMTEAVDRVVPLTVTLVRVQFLSDEPVSTLLWVHGRWLPQAELAGWQSFIERCEAMSPQLSTGASVVTPVGTLRTVRLLIGAGSRGGSAWFASGDGGFPTLTQRSYLRAALTLAGTGLHAARLDHERERAGRTKDEFLAMLGHELRNPLAPIVTALHLIKLRSGDPPMREYQIIERQVGHLSRLVDDLLDVSRITRGKVELKREPVDMRSVLTEAIESVSPLFEERRHELRVDLAPFNGVVIGDPGRLRQVLSNLLTNAAKYTPPRGRVAVTGTSDAQTLSIAVRDNGMGIEPALMPRLFTLFEQGPSTIERSGGGLGIGLALARRLVEMHGGAINARSDGPGQGAEFTIALPLHDVHEPDLTPEPRATRVEPASTARVLIVDDNADALDTLAEVLQAHGFDVATAVDPLRALELAAHFRPQLAVLDIGLPVIDGYELARELRQRHGHEAPAMVAVTGYGQPTDRDRARAAGFAAHLVKPIDVATLLVTLGKLHATTRSRLAQVPGKRPGEAADPLA